MCRKDAFGCPLAAVAAAVFLLLGASHAAAEPQKWAVLIGVDRYASMQPLQYCGNDQSALAKQLLALGFPEDQVFLLHDKADDGKYLPIKENIERQLDLLLKLPEPGDLVLLSFSGHGVHLDGTSYLCPMEGSLDRPGETMIPLDVVFAKMSRCRAALKFMLIDACRNDPRPRGLRGGGDSRGQNELRQFSSSLERPPEGLLLLTSCAPGQISAENDKLKHGVFMHFVLEGLRGKAANRDGSITLPALYDFTSLETKKFVARNHNEYQTPALRGELHGPFEIARVAAGLEKSTTMPATGSKSATASAVPEWFPEVEELIEKEDFLASGQLIDARLQDDPDSSYALACRGVLLINKLEPDAAIRDLNRSIQLNPGFAKAFVWRGAAYRSMYDYDLASADFEQAVRIDPDDAKNYAYRGWCSLSQNQWDRALNDANHALQLDRDNGEAYLLRAAVMGLRDGMEAAHRDANRAAELYIAKISEQPDKPFLHRGLRNAYSWQGEWTKVVETANSVIAKGWGRENDFYVRGLAYRQLNHHAQAIADFTEALRMNPKFAEAYQVRGVVHQIMKNYDQSIRDLTESIRLDSRNALTYVARGNTYTWKNEWDKARADYEQALRVQPGMKIAIEALEKTRK